MEKHKKLVRVVCQMCIRDSAGNDGAFDVFPRHLVKVQDAGQLQRCLLYTSKRETDTMPQWAGSSWYFLR